jgi:hypothetical protein
VLVSQRDLQLPRRVEQSETRYIVEQSKSGVVGVMEERVESCNLVCDGWVLGCSKDGVDSRIGEHRTTHLANTQLVPKSVEDVKYEKHKEERSTSKGRK